VGTVPTVFGSSLGKARQIGVAGTRLHGTCRR
jgi:hypothetical protein